MNNDLYFPYIMILISILIIFIPLNIKYWFESKIATRGLLCSECHARAKWSWLTLWISIVLDFEEKLKYIVCRKCGSYGPDAFERNVNQVVGLIGGNREENRLEPFGSGNKAVVTLISRDEDKARSADIDRLEIHPPADGCPLDYESAVNKVLIALNEDSSRTIGLKKIPVIIHDGVELGNSVQAMLAENFGGVRVNQ